MTKVKDPDIYNHAGLISALDFVCYGVPVDIEKIKKTAKNYSKKYDFMNPEKIIELINKIEEGIIKNVFTEKARKEIKILNYLTRILLALMIGFAIFAFLYHDVLLLYVVYLLFAGAIVVFYLHYRKLSKLDKMVTKIGDQDFLSAKNEILEINKKLIRTLIEKMIEKDAKPEDYKIPLRTKYDEIEIISPPSLTRNYYMGIVKIEK